MSDGLAGIPGFGIQGLQTLILVSGSLYLVGAAPPSEK